MNINEIYFSKRKSVIMPNPKSNECGVNKRFIATMLKNLEFYGYTLSNEAISRVQSLSQEKAINVYEEVTSILKKRIGFKANKAPLYKNFPEEVMEKSESDLYLDAVNYYLSSFMETPESEKVEKYPLLQRVDLKIINLGSEEEFMKIFTNLVSSKSSISCEDKAIIEFFVDKYKGDILNYLPEEIPFKENLAYTTMLCMNYEGALSYFVPKYKTATDVLRLATAMSDGDISLAINTRFKSFKRAERKFLLNLLENANNIKEDMLKHKNKWIKLGERLHPSEYRKLVKANDGFSAMRNNLKVETFNSKLEKAFNEKDLNKVLTLLSKRPGEFARKLDRVLRVYNDEEVIKAFKEVSEKIATPLLLQVREHFSRRNDDTEQRVFFPKGSIAKAYITPFELASIDKNLCEMVVSVCTEALIKLYSEKEELGKVYVSEELKGYIVPTSLRNSSKAVKTMARGSKMDLAKESNIVRLFLYWQEEKGRTTDLDLSAVFYDEEFNCVDRIYFGNLVNKKLNCVHSGDVRQAPEGATEFVDLDLNQLKENGVRYVVASVNSYTGQEFIEMPDCFVGFMEREDNVFGEIFEPKTVSHKADLTSPTGVNIPMIIDIADRKAIWTDLSGEATQLSTVGMSKEKNRLLSALKSMINVCKPNLYDLAILNAISRGEVVENKEDADIVFSLTEGVTPFDTDKLLAEYI